MRIEHLSMPYPIIFSYYLMMACFTICAPVMYYLLKPLCKLIIFRVLWPVPCHRFHQDVILLNIIMAETLPL